MKRLYLFIGFLFLGLTVIAQQNYFIYLQTDNKQPFYVKLDKEIYSSSSSGYAIISKLQKGTYIFNIGFPKKEWPEQKITLNIDSDAGYSLKNFNDKGWGLFNLQTLAVNMANKETEMENSVIEVNDFAGTLANVVNTPSLNEKKVPVKKEPEPFAKTEVTEAVKKQEPTITEKEPEQEVVKNEKVYSTSVTNNSVKRVRKVTDAQGIAMVYIDNSKDTIQVFIADVAPDRKTEMVINPPAVPSKTAEEKIVVNKAEPVVTNVSEDKRFLNMELPNPNAEEGTTTSTQEKNIEIVSAQKEISAAKNEKETTEVKVVTNNKLTFNSDCKAIATDDDFLKTRKRMASETSAEGMINAAKKRFKSACYSTEQIRNLSVLFLKDETRYKFFDAAYPFVHNTQNFPDLVSALTDEYYISRFKAMLR